MAKKKRPAGEGGGVAANAAPPAPAPTKPSPPPSRPSGKAEMDDLFAGLKGGGGAKKAKPVAGQAGPPSAAAAAPPPPPPPPTTTSGRGGTTGGGPLLVVADALPPRGGAPPPPPPPASGKGKAPAGDKDDLFGTAPAGARRRDPATGLPLYSERELGLDRNLKGGGTAACPWDCDCCH